MFSDPPTALRKLAFSPPFHRPRRGNLVGVTWPRLDAHLAVYPFPWLVPSATLPEGVWAKHILSPGHVYFMPQECCHTGPSPTVALCFDLLSAFPPISSIPLIVLSLSLLHILYMKKVWDLILFQTSVFPGIYNFLNYLQFKIFLQNTMSWIYTLHVPSPPFLYKAHTPSPFIPF